MSQYLVELRRLSEHCQFWNLDEVLRDKLVNGLKDVQTQRRLFEIDEDKLIFAKPEQVALAVERTTANAKLLNPNMASPPASVNAVSTEGELFQLGNKTRYPYKPNTQKKKPDTPTNCRGECSRAAVITFREIVIGENSWHANVVGRRRISMLLENGEEARGWSTTGKCSRRRLKWGRLLHTHSILHAGCQERTPA